MSDLIPPRFFQTLKILPYTRNGGDWLSYETSWPLRKCRVFPPSSLSVSPGHSKGKQSVGPRRPASCFPLWSRCQASDIHLLRKDAGQYGLRFIVVPDGAGWFSAVHSLVGKISASLVPAWWMCPPSKMLQVDPSWSIWGSPRGNPKPELRPPRLCQRS
jgi:hypothetical protein